MKPPESRHWILELGFFHFLAIILIISAVGHEFNQGAKLQCVIEGLKKGVEPTTVADLCGTTPLKVDLKIKPSKALSSDETSPSKE